MAVEYNYYTIHTSFKCTDTGWLCNTNTKSRDNYAMESRKINMADVTCADICLAQNILGGFSGKIDWFTNQKV